VSTPWRVDDGSFRYPVAVGRPETSFPFEDEGDLISLIRRQKYRQDGAYWVQSEMMGGFNSSTGGSGAALATVLASNPNFRPITNWRQYARAVGGQAGVDLLNETRLSGGFIGGPTGGAGVGSSRQLCLVAEGPTRDIGSGILEWWKTFAMVPVTRQTGSTIAYTEQVAIVNGEIIEYSTTKNATIVWEYFANDKPSAALAPRVVMINGSVNYIGGATAWQSRLAGKPMLAADQEVGLWMGRIWYRKSIYINPALSFTNA
jgi:hypothetical protein